MLAVRRAGSSSKWSDHSAVQNTVQYTTTKRAPARWSAPRHLLAEPAFVNGELRRLASTRQDGQQSAVADLSRILWRTRCYMTRKVRQEARQRGQRMQLLRKWLAAEEAAMGNEHGDSGYMDTIPLDEPTRAPRVAHYTRRREEI